MSRTARIATRLALGALALVTALGVHPAGAQEVVEPTVRLSVTPEGRAPLGTEIELVATVGLESGGSVTFFDGPTAIGTADLILDIDIIYASITYTPTTQGVHELRAVYGGMDVLPTSVSPVVRYSVLPATCPDQAAPGSGAVVRHAYLTVLDRCPDPAGFAYWTSRLDGGSTPSALGRALALSAEGISATVDTAYRRVLDRAADAGGRAVWAAKLRGGWTTSQLWAALAASPEFITGTSGSDQTTALVDRAFTRLVGRPADPSSQAYWYGRLLSGRPRSAALRALILTPESLGRIVRTTFLDALGRAASPVEQTGTQATIKARRGDWRLLAADVLGWPEASSHAQRYPDAVFHG